MPVRTKRVHDDPDPEDGIRLLGAGCGHAESRRRTQHWNRTGEPARTAPEPLEYTRSGTLPLLSAATDEDHNTAVAPANSLADRLVEG